MSVRNSNPSTTASASTKNKPRPRMYEAIVIGASAGGLEALKIILSSLPGTFTLPVIIVNHIAESSDSYFAQCLNELCARTVKEAEPGETIRPGTIYVAPPGYHL